LRHDADAAHASEEKDAVTEILALHEEVDGEDDDDTEGSDGAKEPHEEFGGGFELSAVGIDDADRLWLRRGLCVSRGSGCEVAADAFDGGEGFLQGLLGRRVNGGHLLLDVETVGGETAGYIEKLAGDDVSNGADDGEGEYASNGDGEDPWNAAGFQTTDGRGEQKREREGEGEGDEQLAGKVEDEYGDGEHEEGFYPGELVASRT
jgi:hypothetical protein